MGSTCVNNGNLVVPTVVLPGVKYDNIVYVPAITLDPRDPLRWPIWRKVVVVLLVTVFSTVALSTISGLGALLTYYADAYGQSSPAPLMIYPTLTMGIGNIVGIPLAAAIGHRPVLLASIVVLMAGTACGAVATTFSVHIVGRLLLGLAAGQTEVLVSMVTQSMFFLHQRSTYLMIQETIQSTLCTIWISCTSPMARALTPQGWYWFGFCVAGVELIAVLFLLPETLYDRCRADGQVAPDRPQMEIRPYTRRESNAQSPMRGLTPPSVRICRKLCVFLRPWHNEPRWNEGIKTLTAMVRAIATPHVFWACCINGVAVAMSIAVGSTYSTILSRAPYDWPSRDISFVNWGLIVVFFISLPIFGLGSDFITRWRARRNRGIHDPKSRLLLLPLPIIIGVTMLPVYGDGIAHPSRYHWFMYVWAIATTNFCFIGINIITFSFLLDGCPQFAGAMLAAVCVLRGFFSFGISYGITSSVFTFGHSNAFGVLAAILGFVGLSTVAIYFGRSFGKKAGDFEIQKKVLYSQDSVQW